MNKENLNIRSVPHYDMIVFCHLRWDFVYQRPQHIISRLSQEYKILVVEEPINISNGEKSKLNLRKISSNIHVLQPEVSSIEEIGQFLKKHLKKTNFAVGWFYSAAFVSVLNIFEFETVVYDCMDELTLFKGASSQLINQESQLMAAADVVYTGGKSLYESKKEKHHNVHCFPSSVDLDHFTNEKKPSSQSPVDINLIPSPIVGYYGVIDERIDLELLKNTATLCPDVSFIMIGPICKIEFCDLPKASNIYYLGMKTYDELPVYLQRFDIAMMPFALNDSTKYISPTKTLEYMTAYKPIISTRIKDVERDYSNCVQLIDNEDEFKEAITNPNKNFQKEYDEILQKTSWDATVTKMNSLINKVTT